MSDIMSMLAPGGAAAGGPPPDALAALLGGAGGGAPADAALPPGPQDGSPGGGSDHLNQTLVHLQAAMDAESDQADLQIMSQCYTKLQGILAKDEAGADSMMGGKASPRDVRKASAAAGYGG